jgi:hypothetical protein
MIEGTQCMMSNMRVRPDTTLTVASPRSGTTRTGTMARGFGSAAMQQRRSVSKAMPTSPATSAQLAPSTRRRPVHSFEERATTSRAARSPQVRRVSRTGSRRAALWSAARRCNLRNRSSTHVAVEQRADACGARLSGGTRRTKAFCDRVARGWGETARLAVWRDGGARAETINLAVFGHRPAVLAHADEASRVVTVAYLACSHPRDRIACPGRAAAQP